MVPVDTEKAKYNAVYVTGRVGGVDRDIEEYTRNDTQILIFSILA